MQIRLSEPSKDESEIPAAQVILVLQSDGERRPTCWLSGGSKQHFINVQQYGTPGTDYCAYCNTFAAAAVCFVEYTVLWFWSESEPTNLCNLLKSIKHSTVL